MKKLIFGIIFSILLLNTFSNAENVNQWKLTIVLVGDIVRESVDNYLVYAAREDQPICTENNCGKFIDGKSKEMTLIQDEYIAYLYKGEILQRTIRFNITNDMYLIVRATEPQIT